MTFRHKLLAVVLVAALAFGFGYFLLRPSSQQQQTQQATAPSAAPAPGADGAAAPAPAEYISVGTGGVTGVYYPAGGAICRLVNNGRKQHGLRCSVESTDGSVYNINAMRAGELDMGVVQSDVQYDALKGTGPFAKAGPFEALRSMFSVHPEPFTVVARADAGIAAFADLKGKRVNIGNPGSGQRNTMETVMAAMGWTTADFALVMELPSAAQSQALCDNKFDAMVFTVGHPNGSIKEATASCDAVIVPVTGPAIDKLVADNPYYRKAVVPGGMYRGSDSDVPTFGVGATLVTTAAMRDDVAYWVVKSVFGDFDTFTKLHPAFANLKPKEMLRDGLSAPLHDGAVKYYKERGWM